MKTYPGASKGITCGQNIFYNTSHPLLNLIIGHLESENESPYHSKPFYERISQIWVEGETGEVPTIAPKIMLDEDKIDKIMEGEGEGVILEDERIQFDLPNNTATFRAWYKEFRMDEPFKTTTLIENYVSSDRLPRHISEDAYLIHGAKLYDAYNSTAHGDITLLISEAPGTTADKTLSSVENNKDRPFARVLIMTGEERDAKDIREANEHAALPTKMQRRKRPAYDNMDLCEAKIDTKWFMMVDSRREVSEFVDLMFAVKKDETDARPVVPFVEAYTHGNCGRFPYCEKTATRARRIYSEMGWSRIVHTDDMLFHTDGVRNFCKFWTQKNGDSLLRKTTTSDAPVGPTASEYVAYLEKVEENSQEHKVKKRGGKDCKACCSYRVYSRKKGHENVPGSSLYMFSDRAWYRKPFAFFPFPNSLEELVGGSPSSMLTKSAAQKMKALKNVPTVLRVAEE